MRNIRCNSNEKGLEMFLVPEVLACVYCTSREIDQNLGNIELHETLSLLFTWYILNSTLESQGFIFQNSGAS